MTDHPDIVERLNNVTPDQGWAVVNKKTEGIVIWFSKLKTLNARREALAFMGENPHYAETHEIREYTNPCIEHEAAAEITRLRAEADALRKDAERWAKEANRCDDLICGWHAACAFIDADVLKVEDEPRYTEFMAWRKHLEAAAIAATKEQQA